MVPKTKRLLFSSWISNNFEPFYVSCVFISNFDFNMYYLNTTNYIISYSLTLHFSLIPE